MDINTLVERAHTTAKSKGWWDGATYNIPEKLALIHSEVSEALEEYRTGMALQRVEVSADDGKPLGFATELADVVIRVADLCGLLGIDLGAVISQKMAYNDTRPHRHGGKRC